MLAEIHEALARHRAFDVNERRHLESMRDLAARGEDGLGRGNYRPGHFTVSAFVLSPDAHGLLLIHHIGLGRWLQPGGHIEPEDRDIESAARREILEETGLTELRRVPTHSGLFDVDVHSIPARASEPAHRHHDLRLLFLAQNTGIVAGEGVHAARWIQLDDFEKLATDPSLRRALDKLRQPDTRARTARA